jgi:glucose-1-phosphate thymidylyltransferase
MVKVDEVIGLLPAGGRGTRIEPLPCSKELFPIGFRKIDGQDEMRPKVVSHYLLEKMRVAGIRKAFLILRQGKWDIPSYFGDGSILDMDLAYLMMRVPLGPPYTLDQAYPFVRDKKVAFGFPDIIFDADDAFVKLLERQTTTKADVVLGLFAVDQPTTMDMVDVENGAVRSIVIKPAVTNLRWGWIIAVWTDVFTEFLHEHLVNLLQGTSAAENRAMNTELTVGEVFQAALSRGLKMQGVEFSKSSYLDIGTPDNLIKAIYGKKFTED